MPDGVRYQSLQALEAETWLAEATSPDGKLRFMVNKDGEGWARAVADCTRAAGEKALSWGGGQKMDAEQGNKKEAGNQLTIPIKLTDDRAQVYFTKAGEQNVSRYRY